jgi:adenine/guanine phosphoribosyltransferase-like PRPP-binding protein
LLSEVRFGSYLVYSPRGTSEVSRRSRRFRDSIKAGDEEAIRTLVAHLAARFDETELDQVLGPDVTLIPVPRSSLLVEGGLWPARRIADALVSAGLAKQVIPALARTVAVPKSAFVKVPGERPNARRHYETMAAAVDLTATARIALVDDVVTKGNTSLGGASRIVEAFPDAEVSVFALLRTKGLQPEIEAIVEPCVGRIYQRYLDEADREP